MDIFALDGKVAVVTGACGKLGRVWVSALARYGSNVVATDLQEDASSGIAHLKSGGNVSYYGGVDVTVRNDVKKLYEFCKDTYGVADILVNNAGIDQPPSKDAEGYTIEDYPEDIFNAILKVNAFGPFNMIQEFGCGMRAKGTGGSIINIGSLYASVSPDEKFYTHLVSGGGSFIKPPSYGMSKAAIVNLTKYLAAHWGKYGIRVNTLSPGGVEGGQDPEFIRKFCDRVPLGRMANNDDLIGPLVFLASDASSYITGIELRADGGFTSW